MFLKATFLKLLLFFTQMQLNLLLEKLRSTVSNIEFTITNQRLMVRSLALCAALRSVFCLLRVQVSSVVLNPT